MLRPAAAAAALLGEPPAPDGAALLPPCEALPFMAWDLSLCVWHQERDGELKLVIDKRPDPCMGFGEGWLVRLVCVLLQLELRRPIWFHTHTLERFEAPFGRCGTPSGARSHHAAPGHTWDRYRGFRSRRRRFDDGQSTALPENTWCS